jgi:hypothetical protein
MVRIIRSIAGSKVDHWIRKMRNHKGNDHPKLTCKGEISSNLFNLLAEVII